MNISKLKHFILTLSRLSILILNIMSFTNHLCFIIFYIFYYESLGFESIKYTNKYYDFDRSDQAVSRAAACFCVSSVSLSSLLNSHVEDQNNKSFYLFIYF